jgi:hypothetical protein
MVVFLLGDEDIAMWDMGGTTPGDHVTSYIYT